MKNGWNMRLAAAFAAALLLSPAAGASAAEVMTETADMNGMGGMTEMKEMKEMTNMAEMSMASMPLRKTAETLGYDVQWDAASNTVRLSYRGMDEAMAMRVVTVSLVAGTVDVDGARHTGMYGIAVDRGVTYVDAYFVDEVLKSQM